MPMPSGRLDADADAPRYAVFGQPIAHSLSPRIHATFGRQLGIALDYRAIEVGRDGLAATLAEFAAAGGCGANLTLPLKETAAALCATLSPRVRACGSVNTIVRNGSGWHGDSTDGAGLVRDLTVRHGIDLRERRLLLLGAGGAARAVLPALLDAGVGETILVNRTPQRADVLADAFAAHRVRACRWHELAACGAFDLVVNATSAGHGATMPHLPASLLAAHAVCYDLSYGPAARDFLAWARAAGAARSLDGLGMLVEQAAEAFACWHGAHPDTDPVYAALREG